MKKIILTAILVLGVLTVSAQKKEAVYKKIAEKSCECALQKGASNISQMDLGICLFEGINILDTKELKVLGINPDDKMGSIESVAEAVGIEMAMTCPVIFENIGYENGEVVFQKDKEKEVKRLTFTNSGVVEEVTTKEFKTIKIKDASNTIQEFLWLNQFEGDSLLINGKIVKGDKVEIVFAEEQFFDSKVNAYRAFNVIK